MKQSTNWVSHREAARCMKDHLKQLRPKLSPQQILDQSQNPLGSFRRWAAQNKPNVVRGRPQRYQYEGNALAAYLTPVRFPLLTSYVRTWPGDHEQIAKGVTGTLQLGSVTTVILPPPSLTSAKRIRLLEALVIEKSQEVASLHAQLKQTNEELAAYKQKQAKISSQNSEKARRNTATRDRSDRRW